MKIKLAVLPETMEIQFADKTMNWQDAVDWAKEQGGRLPTKFELQAIAEAGKIPKDRRGYYWSASTFSYTTGYAWNVDLKDGYASGNYKTNAINNGALCVS